MKKNKKIVLLSLSYKPSVGGLVSYMESFSNFLINKSISVDIFCSDSKNKSLKKSEVMNGVNITRMPVFAFPKILKIFTPFVITYQFIRFLSKFDFSDYEIIVCRHVYLAVALSFIQSAKKKTIFIVPLISPKLEVINLNKKSFIKKIYGAILVPQLYFLEKLAVKKLDNIAVLSESKKEELLSYYKIEREISVIPPGVDLERFSSKTQTLTAALKKSILKDIQSNEVILSTVCRLVEEKNVEGLLYAFSILIHNLMPDRPISLVIAGDGPLQKHLESLCISLKIDKNVIFLGFFDKPELVYSLSDIFVLPSVYEGFGHVLIEANACGTPCIAIKNNPPEIITAADEIIENNINGLIAEDATPESIAGTIKSLIASIDIEGTNVWNKRCVDYATKQFGWSNHLQLLQGILDE